MPRGTTVLDMRKYSRAACRKVTRQNSRYPSSVWSQPVDEPAVLHGTCWGESPSDRQREAQERLKFGLRGRQVADLHPGLEIDRVVHAVARWLTLWLNLLRG